MTDRPGFFDASTPPVLDTGDRLLEQQQVGEAARGLEGALGRVAEHVARAREAEARDGLDESTLRLLETLTGGDDASLERRSLHDRVAAGRITWAQVWAYPQAEAGGRSLVLDVVGLQARDAADARLRFAEVEASEGGGHR